MYTAPGCLISVTSDIIHCIIAASEHAECYSVVQVGIHEHSWRVLVCMKTSVPHWYVQLTVIWPFFNILKVPVWHYMYKNKKIIDDHKDCSDIKWSHNWDFVSMFYKSIGHDITQYWHPVTMVMELFISVPHYENWLLISRLLSWTLCSVHTKTDNM